MGNKDTRQWCSSGVFVSFERILNVFLTPNSGASAVDFDQVNSVLL